MTNLVLVVALVYALMALAVYLFQDRMVFLANLPGRALTASPADIGLAFEDVAIPTPDGEQLHGWYVPAVQSRGVLLFFHGNAGNISHRLESIATFHRLDLDVLIIDYRGYGRSTGKPGERGLYTDAEAAWDHLVVQKGIDPERIIIFGRSLGGAVAAQLASRREPGGLILESVFSSGIDMASTLYRFLPARLITRLEFPVTEFVARIDCPVLVIHSRDDEIIPYAMGERVFHAAGSARKSFLEIQGGHNTGFILSEDTYLPALTSFTRQVLGHLARE
ncbi:MAG: alpha/beta hydrolase [Xanthomonadales bacterium]|nr:alpha/beta hydrolase [Xanthomonadales bacterium]